MKTILFCAALVVACTAFAQEPVYKWGDIHTNQFDAQMKQIISMDETGFYVLREGGPITSEIRRLEKYDFNYNMIFSENLITENPGVMGNSLLYRQTIAGDHVFYIFYDGWIKAEGKAFCYVRMMDTNGKIIGEGKELVSNKAEKQMNSGNYYPILSPDNKKLLVFTELPHAKEANEQIRLNVFDAQTLHTFWESDFTLDFESKAGARNQALIDNAGNAFILKKVSGPKQTENYFFYSCDAKTKELKSNALDFNGNLSVDDRFLFNASQQPVFAGFYGPDDDKIAGTFYFSLNPATSQMLITKLEPFGATFLDFFKSSANAAKPDATISNLMIKDILPKTNGDLLLISEFSAETKSIADAVTGEYEYSIQTAEIPVINLTSDGTKSWFTILRKRQSEKTHNREMAYSSFNYALVKDQLFILWNNVDLTPTSIPPQQWEEPDGTVYLKNKVFDYKTTRHATFLYAVGVNGEQTFSDRKFGIPLFNLHTGSPYSLSMNPNIFWGTDEGIIILANMHDDAKRYRFGFIDF